MFCWRHREEEEKKPPILNLQKILQDHIWETFLEETRYRRLCLRRQDYVIDVPMSYFLIEPIPSTQKVKVREDPRRDDKGEKGRRLNADSNTVHIATDFVNHTNKDQTYRFRLEKTRKAVLNVSVQRGFTFGGKAQITIALPALPSSSGPSVEADLRINVTKTEGEAIEETVVFETTSDIHVEERSQCVAWVVLNEKRVCYDFSSWSRLSMPTGGANTTILRKRDNRTVFYHTITSLETVFQNYFSKNEVELKEFKTEGKNGYEPMINCMVDIKTSGVIEGVRLSDQKILLKSHKLDRSRCSVSRPTPLEATSGHISQQEARALFSNSSQRPSYTDDPIIEETSDDEKEENDKIPIGNGRTAPLICTASPSSAASSPMSERAGSEGSDVSKTITTV